VSHKTERVTLLRLNPRGKAIEISGTSLKGKVLAQPVFDFELEFLTVAFCFRPRCVAASILESERIKAQKSNGHSDQENNVLHGTKTLLK
jgi:hypothetical protein